MPKTRQLLEECACHKVRMAARAVTRAYDEALRPTGLRATQVLVLIAAASRNALSIASLSRLLGMDRSTLARNLGPLAQEGLVSLGAEGWRRSRMVEITRQGKQRLRMALPLWEKVQRGLRHKLGEARWAALRCELDYLGQSADSLRPEPAIR